MVEYVHDIYNYLRYMESVQFVSPAYLDGQKVNVKFVYAFTAGTGTMSDHDEACTASLYLYCSIPFPPSQ